MLFALILFMTLQHHGAGLGFSHSQQYDDYENDVCDVTSLASSAYVTAVYRPTDCNSTSRDVYVIDVKTASQSEDLAPRRPHRRRQAVTLNITPADNDSSVGESYEGRDLLFVLNSAAPVVWTLDLRRVSPNIRLQFWLLNNESRVLRGDRVNVKVRRTSVSQSVVASVESLTAWTERHIGRVTGVRQLQLTSTITHTLSTHSGVGRPCSDSQHVQPIEGCEARWNEGAHGRDVHILEVSSAGRTADNTGNTGVSSGSSGSTGHAAAGGAVGLPVIQVFAHARKTTSRRQHFVLVLRAHEPVVWRIRTKGLRGTLDLITDYSVDTNAVDMNLVRVVTERLGSLSSTALVAWTADKYGPAVSYTRVNTANYLDLRVDGAVDVKSSPAGNVDPASALDWTNDAVTAVEFIRSSLLRSRSLVCHSDGLTLSLRKHLLKMYGISRDQLTLRDRSCRPRENRTHYYWSTKFSQCATQARHFHDKTSFQNAILVTWPGTYQDEFEIDEEDEGDEEEYYSGSGQGQGHDVDVDTDYRRTFGIDFSCDYSRSESTAAGGQNNVYLKLFSDINYQTEIGSFPSDVEEQRTVYVEAGITADTSKQVMIHNCSLVPTESRYQHPLIVKGCALDKTVRWLDSDLHPSQRFEFMFQKYWDSDKEMMLLCELTVCRRSSNNVASDIPLCVTKTRYCVESNIMHSSLPRRPAPNVVLSRGPLMLRLSGSNNEATGTPVTNRASESCNGPVHVDGLETTAVICIAFAAFIIGVLLAGALWYIHSHTGSPRKPHQQSLDTSGESTPCSNVQIAIHQVHRHV